VDDRCVVVKDIDDLGAAESAQIMGLSPRSGKKCSAVHDHSVTPRMRADVEHLGVEDTPVAIRVVQALRRAQRRSGHRQGTSIVTKTVPKGGALMLATLIVLLILWWLVTRSGM
jgi:hypothetical protein